MTTSKSKKAWALEWISKGLHVFPCIPDSKLPAVAGAYQVATLDPAQISLWWGNNPDYNIGCAPDASGHFVIDIDTKDDGYATLLGLGLDPEETFCVATPSGGLHLWYKGHGPSTVRALGPGCDTRGRGGFVLLPGSILLAGSYTETRPLEQGVSDAPAGILAGLAEREGRNTQSSASGELDLPVNVRRAEAFLAKADVAVEGQGGDALTYETACWLRDLGISENYALDMMLDWNERCEPPWDPEELAQKVEHAYIFARNEPGAKAERSSQEAFASYVGSTSSANSDTGKPKLTYRLRTEAEDDARQPPEWFIDGLVPLKGLTLVYGAPGSYKSFVALDMALSAAASLPCYGLDVKPGPVIYLAGEGALGIAKKRRPAWRLAKQITGPIPFYTLDVMPLARDSEAVIKFVDDVKAQDVMPQLVVVDTLARLSLGLNENDVKEIGLSLAALEYIRRELNTTVIAIHHSGKDDSRGARGSSSIQGAVDAALYIKANPEARAVTIINEAPMGKQKDAEPHPNIVLKGEEVFGSLVFRPIAASEAKALAASADALTHSEVFDALKALSAVDIRTSQNTRVLAVEIMKLRGCDGNEDDYAKRLGNCERNLRRLSKDRLAGYCSDLDGTKAWYVTED